MVLHGKVSPFPLYQYDVFKFPASSHLNQQNIFKFPARIWAEMCTCPCFLFAYPTKNHDKHYRHRTRIFYPINTANIHGMDACTLLLVPTAICWLYTILAVATDNTFRHAHNPDHTQTRPTKSALPNALSVSNTRYRNWRRTLHHFLTHSC